MYGTTCSSAKRRGGVAVGITISPSWMLQVGHHVSTFDAPVAAKPATVLPPTRPDGLEVARAELDHAAAVRGAAEDRVARADAVEHVHAEQRDVRRLHHVAAEVEHDVGRWAVARVRRARDARDEVRGELQARQHLHAAATSC